MKYTYTSRSTGSVSHRDHPFEGMINNVERRYRETHSDFMKERMQKYMVVRDCPDCRGKRLKPEVLAVTVGGKNLAELSDMSIRDAYDFIDNLQLTEKEELIGRQIIKEIKARLNFLLDVGLEYLTLSRASGTLSGGESQRIRLATQIGSSLMGVLYILDEPSIGLHQRDNEKLLDTLRHLTDIGNTLLVVEHDEDTMYAADHIIDIGPAAGIYGGELVAQARWRTSKPARSPSRASICRERGRSPCRKSAERATANASPSKERRRTTCSISTWIFLWANSSALPACPAPARAA